MEYIGSHDPSSWGEQWRCCAKSGKSARRYAVVDMQAVILNIEDGKKARADLEKEIKSKEKELIGRKKELDKMNKDWQEQMPLLERGRS